MKFSKFKKFFKVFYKNKSGRNNTGCITVYSKGIKKKYNTIPTIKPIKWDKQLSLLVGIIRNKKKLISIIRHHTGSFSVKPSISGSYVGQFIFSSNLPSNYWVAKLPGNLVLLKYLTRYSVFSNIYVNGFKKFALSNGTYCQVLESFFDFNLIKVILPSKRTKILSGWNFVFLGKNSQENYMYNRLGKAGICILTGKKPKVRGVARNPVDHPHGGRTKTNQPEVSMWGWIAKRSK